MAYEIIRPNFQLPISAGSVLVPRTPVKLVGSSVLLVLPVASSNDRPFGMIGEATAPVTSPTGDAVSGFAAVVIEEGNIVKAIAAASLGVGVEVTMATLGVATNAQGGSYLATVPQLGPITVASGSGQWAVGLALTPAKAGELFSLYIKPRQTGGLA